MPDKYLNVLPYTLCIEDIAACKSCEKSEMSQVVRKDKTEKKKYLGFLVRWEWVKMKFLPFKLTFLVIYPS